MNQYLVMYQPPHEEKFYPSLHIWPEILAILKKRDEIGGRIFIYMFRYKSPIPLRIKHCVESYWLEDMYGNYVEG